MLEHGVEHPVAPPLEAGIVLPVRIVAMQHVHAAGLEALVSLPHGFPVLLLAPVVTVLSEVAQRFPVEKEHGAAAGPHGRHRVEPESIGGVVLQNLANLHGA